MSTSRNDSFSGKLVTGLFAGMFDCVVMLTRNAALTHFVKAMDIAGLSKLSSETLVLIVSILGYLVSSIVDHSVYPTHI